MHVECLFLILTTWFFWTCTCLCKMSMQKRDCQCLLEFHRMWNVQYVILHIKLSVNLFSSLSQSSFGSITITTHLFGDQCFLMFVQAEDLIQLRSFRQHGRQFPKFRQILLNVSNLPNPQTGTHPNELISYPFQYAGIFLDNNKVLSACLSEDNCQPTDAGK